MPFKQDKPAEKMRRGAAMSSLLHGGIIALLVFGWPTFRLIFDETPEEGREIFVDILVQGETTDGRPGGHPEAILAGEGGKRRDFWASQAPPPSEIMRSTPSAPTAASKAPSATATAGRRTEPKPANRSQTSKRTGADPTTPDIGAPSSPATEKNRAPVTGEIRTRPGPTRKQARRESAISPRRTRPSESAAPAIRAPTRDPAAALTSRRAPPRPPADGGIDSVAPLLREIVATDRRLADLIRTTQFSPARGAKARQEQKTMARLRRAAEQGYAVAQFNFAWRAIGAGAIGEPRRKALSWLRRAAEQNYAPAQLMLGYLAAEGKVIPRDYRAAHAWWTLSAPAIPAAAIGRDGIAKLMTPNERRGANRIAAKLRRLRAETSPPKEGVIRRAKRDAALRIAASDGDLETARILLAAGADPDARGATGENAVISAAWRGRTGLVKALLARGANTDAEDGEGKSALVWAAINGHGEVAEMLIDAGAALDRRDAQGRTALIRAAWNGHRDVVEALIDAGSGLNLRDRLGRSALDYARDQRNDAMVRILRAAGADS